MGGSGGKLVGIIGGQSWSILPGSKCDWNGGACALRAAPADRARGEGGERTRGPGYDSGTLWVRDPCAILAEDAARGIVVDSGRIVETVPAGAEPITPGCTVFDAGRHVVLPGLVNTHHHFYQALTRATPAALDRELFPWLTALYPIWARLTPDLLDCAATVALAELLLSGCTTTTDHHYVFPAGLEQAIDIEIAAAQRLGARVVLTRGSMNLSQRDGGLPPDSVVQDEDTILADSARLIDHYHQPDAHAMAQVALAPCSPFSVSTSLMRRTAELAEARGVRLHTHLAETRDEAEFCRSKYGCSPLDRLARCLWGSVPTRRVRLRAQPKGNNSCLHN
jgi:8-oxoguanine deaminase